MEAEFLQGSLISSINCFGFVTFFVNSVVRSCFSTISCIPNPEIPKI